MPVFFPYRTNLPANQIQTKSTRGIRWK